MSNVLRFDSDERRRDAGPGSDASALSDHGAEERVAWTLERFPGGTVLTSSFGAQSAVLLHMVTRQQPDIPVILIDTGYLFPETYRFVDELTERLALQLHVYRPRLSAAWQEVRYGRLWQQGVDGIDRYNRMNKVEPLQRALADLGARAWLSGIRRDQARTRASREFVESRNGRTRVHPILDWSDRDVHRYLKTFDLPYHPLWHEGYISIGDVHTTARLADGMDVADVRFFGLKRECGIHEQL